MSDPRTESSPPQAAGATSYEEAAARVEEIIRRLDSGEAVMEWLAEVDAKRAEEAAAGADAGT